MTRNTFYWLKLPMTTNHLPIMYPGNFLYNFENSPAFWGADTVKEIINLSFAIGIYPTKLKEAKVIPIFKNKGDPGL